MSNPMFGTVAGIMEITLNKVLPLDPGFQEKIKGLAGRVIGITFVDWQMELFFLPDEYQFTVLSSYLGETDVKLSGKSWDFFHMGINQHSSDSAPMLDSNIRFEGDVAVGQKFAQLLTNLNIDWEEALADVMGDIVAHRAANVFKQAGSWFKEAISSTQDNISEYVQEEIAVTPAKIEIENFFDDLADLRADAERLEARFLLLKNKINKSSSKLDSSEESNPNQ